MEIYNDTYCVYVHINKINGKIYVGQTIHGDGPNKRWESGSGYKSSPHFWNAIQKYGWDNFEHEIVASNLTKEEADNFEILLIKELKTYDNNFGYNLTLGGGGLSGYSLSEETKRKISESNRGKKLSDETKRKIGIASTGRNIGRKHTKEELEKMKKKREERKYKKTKRLARSGNYVPTEETKRKIQDSSHKKTVLQKDFNGNILQQYDSMSDASRKTGINLGNISSCCNGRVHTAGGFIWEFN